MLVVCDQIAWRQRGHTHYTQHTHTHTRHWSASLECMGFCIIFIHHRFDRCTKPATIRAHEQRKLFDFISDSFPPLAPSYNFMCVSLCCAAVTSSQRSHGQIYIFTQENLSMKWSSQHNRQPASQPTGQTSSSSKRTKTMETIERTRTRTWMPTPVAKRTKPRWARVESMWPMHACEQLNKQQQTAKKFTVLLSKLF